jgi:hypothetical protein
MVIFWQAAHGRWLLAMMATDIARVLNRPPWRRRTLVAVRAFRDESNLAAGQVSGRHQILVIHPPSSVPAGQRGHRPRGILGEQSD